MTGANVVVDLLGRFAAEPIERALFGGGTQPVAPELLDLCRDVWERDERLVRAPAVVIDVELV